MRAVAGVADGAPPIVALGDGAEVPDSGEAIGTHAPVNSILKAMIGARPRQNADALIAP
jgi:hypothetical protein